METSPARLSRRSSGGGDRREGRKEEREREKPAWILKCIETEKKEADSPLRGILSLGVVKAPVKSFVWLGFFFFLSFVVSPLLLLKDHNGLK